MTIFSRPATKQQDNDSRRADDIRKLGACPMRLRQGRYRADARLQIPRGKPQYEIANLGQFAEAAYRLTLVGAATTGARGGHLSFDPIEFGHQAGVGRHGNGLCSNTDRPVSYEVV